MLLSPQIMSSNTDSNTDVISIIGLEGVHLMKQIAAFISNYPAGFGVSILGRKKWLH